VWCLLAQDIPLEFAEFQFTFGQRPEVVTSSLLYELRAGEQRAGN
jgi:hypothetical protein